MAQAQLEQGNWVVGLSSNFFGGGNGITIFHPNTVGFGVTSSKYKSDDVEVDLDGYTTFNLSPNVGTFIMDDLLIGVGLGLDFYKGEDDDFSYFTFGISPFVRYYFDLENIKPFVQVGGGVGTDKFGPDDEDKESITHLGIGAGIALFLNDKISVDIGLGYTTESYKQDDDSKFIYNTFGLGIGLTMFL